MKRRSDQKPRRIGVLVDWTVDSYQQSFLDGIIDFTQENDLSCICFEGGAINSPFKHERERNIIFQLATRDVVDGLIILSAPIAHFISSAEMERVFLSNRPLPQVSASMQIQGVPSVLADNRSGMRDLLIHLIEKHHFRRFGFIKGMQGNRDAAERLGIFEETLREYGIPVDSRFVFDGDFSTTAGIKFVDYLLDQGAADLEVIVASNDNMALGAMQELVKRGIRVPDQIAITGFDNVDISSYSSPSLTTIKLPIFEMGKMTGRMIKALWEGEDVPPTTYLPTSLVIRESCRCLSHQAVGTAAAPAVEYFSDPSILPVFNLEMSGIRGSTENGHPPGIQPAPGGLVRTASPILLERAAALDTPTLPGLENDHTPKALIAEGDFWDSQRLLFELWQHRIPVHQDPESLKTQELSFQAFLRLGQKAIRKEWQRINGFIQENRAIDLIRVLMSTMDNTEQMNNIAGWLPELDINSCYISLYRSEPGMDRKQSVCVMGLREKERIQTGSKGINFPTRRLVPDDFLSDRTQRVVIVEGLREFGFIVFDLNPERGRIYNMLSYMISGAMQQVVYFKELQDQKNNLTQTLAHMRKVMAGFIHTMSLTVEARDPYTSGHQHRVSDLARSIANEMGLSSLQVEGVRMAGIIHDLGKIYIPTEILNRAGPLDENEWGLIIKHPKVAYDILRNVDFPWPIADIIYQHHERINGSGYPNGLSGEAIFLEARILAVADVVEAMSSRRPYREALGMKKALEEIINNKGVLYEPDVVDACVRLIQSKGYRFKNALPRPGRPRQKPQRSMMAAKPDAG